MSFHVGNFAHVEFENMIFNNGHSVAFFNAGLQVACSSAAPQDIAARALASLCCDKQKLESSVPLCLSTTKRRHLTIVTAQNRSDMMNSEIIRRYGESRLPRYTSYPTAPAFRPA